MTSAFVSDFQRIISSMAASVPPASNAFFRSSAGLGFVA